MARRLRKKKRDRAPTLDTSTAVSRILGKIEDGKTQGALRDAKRLVSASPSKQSTELLFTAYLAHVRDLLRRGLADQANELVEVARERYPERSQDFGREVGRVALESGVIDPLLAEWAGAALSAQRRSELTGLLRQHIIDPRSVAESPTVPDDDPLREAARAAARALDEAGRGALSATGRAGLRAIGRRSPLAPWRHFALALDAFHREDDDSMHLALGFITDDCAPAPLARILEGLARGCPPKPAGPTVRRLARRVTGDVFPLRESAATLAVAIEQQDVQTVPLYQDLLKRLASHDLHLALRLARWFVTADETPWFPEEVHVEVLKVLPRGEKARLDALLAEDLADDPLQTFVCWCFWLGERRNRKPRSDIDFALLAEHLAEVIEQAEEHLADLIEEGEIDEHDLERARHGPRSFESQHELNDTLDRLGEEGTAAATYLSQRRELGRILARWCARDFPDGPELSGALRELALVCDPTSERFQLHARRLKSAPAPERDAFLERWAASAPREVEPLLALATGAERRGALKKALAAIDRAALVNPLDQDVRRAHFRILCGNLVRHLRSGNSRLARQDLARIEGTAAARGPERVLVLAATDRLLAQWDTDANREADLSHELQRLTGCNEAARDADRLIAYEATPTATRKPIVLEGSPRERLASAVRIARLAREIDPDPAGVIDPSSLPVSARDNAFPADGPELETLCAVALRHQATDLLYAASGQGLATGGPLLPRFYYYRWCSLRNAPGIFDESMECKHWALYWARRHQDHEMLRKLTAEDFFSRLIDLADPHADQPSHEEAELALARERSQPQTLAKRVGHRPVLGRFDGPRPSKPRGSGRRGGRTRKQQRGKEREEGQQRRQVATPSSQLGLPFMDVETEDDDDR